MLSTAECQVRPTYQEIHTFFLYNALSQSSVFMCNMYTFFLHKPQSLLFVVLCPPVPLLRPLRPLSTLSSLAVECQHKKDGGIGSDYVILWYYDMTSRSCRRFWYGGQGGNGNRFESKQECDDMCVHRVVVTSPSQEC